MKYWLMKSEPEDFSLEDLRTRPQQLEPWTGVRNYQARNFMRDDMQVRDKVFFYHSNATPPGIAGLAEIASEPFPDPTAFDSRSKYFDPKADAKGTTYEGGFGKRVLGELVDSGFDHVIVNLTRLEFLDSTGLRLLLDLHASSADGTFVLELVPGPAAVQRVFEVTSTVTMLPFAWPSSPATYLQGPRHPS